MFEPELAGHARERLHALHTRGPAIDVSPHGAPRLHPRRLDPVGKERRIRRRTKIGKDRARRQRVEIASDHHHAPRRRDVAGDGGRLAEALAFLTTVAQLERIVQRLPMAETNHPAAATVRLQSHAAVVHEVGFGDRRVAAVLWQLECQRRSGPLSGPHRGGVLLHVGRFVVPLTHARVPHGRSHWHVERRPFVRHARCGGIAWNDVAVRDAVVEGANLQRVGDRRQVVRERERRAVGVAGRGAADARPRVALVHLVSHNAVEHDAGRQVIAVEGQDDRRWFDHRGVSERNGERESLGVREEGEGHLSIGTAHVERGHLHALRTARRRLLLRHRHGLRRRDFGAGKGQTDGDNGVTRGDHGWRVYLIMAGTGGSLALLTRTPPRSGKRTSLVTQGNEWIDPRRTAGR